ncbi:MAG TPA: lipopolysaccharide assembly protein LapA domain-containing protein [Pseudonocardiaceae bacterium]|nr:lipopolysaccharide assembly protein LapA domain-containing protein [Pseudonocardiaceae bacterium]
MAEQQHLPDTPDTDQLPVQSPGAPVPAPATEQPPGAPTTEHPYHQVRRTRTSGLWIAATVAAVVLLVLLVFIIENGQSVSIAFFGAHGRLPLGVALLLAAICGVLLVAIPGYGRILQLRRALRRSANGPG